MPTQRHANVNWTFPTNQNGVIEDWRYVEMAILMDIRDELQRLNRLLHCPNFIDIPSKLRRISQNTYESKQRKKNADK